MPDVSTIAQQLVAELGDQNSLTIRGKPIFEWCAERGGTPRLAPPNPDYDAIERWDFEDASAIIVWYSADLWDEAAHSTDACVNDPDLLWVGATDRPECMEPDQARAAYREKEDPRDLIRDLVDLEISRPGSWALLQRLLRPGNLESLKQLALAGELDDCDGLKAALVGADR